MARAQDVDCVSFVFDLRLLFVFHERYFCFKNFIFCLEILFGFTRYNSREPNNN